jgi:hypothetical protein
MTSCQLSRDYLHCIMSCCVVLNICEEIQRTLKYLGLGSTGVFLIDKSPIYGALSGHLSLRNPIHTSHPTFCPNLSSQLPNHRHACTYFSRASNAFLTLPLGSLSLLPSNSTKKMYWKGTTFVGLLLMLVRLRELSWKH